MSSPRIPVFQDSFKSRNGVLLRWTKNSIVVYMQMTTSSSPRVIRWPLTTPRKCTTYYHENEQKSYWHKPPSLSPPFASTHLSPRLWESLYRRLWMSGLLIARSLLLQICMADLSVALAKVRGNSHFLRKNTSRSTRLCYARIAADTTGTLQNGGKVCHASSVCTFSLVVCFATPKIRRYHWMKLKVRRWMNKLWMLTPKLDQNIDEPMRYPKLILIWKK